MQEMGNAEEISTKERILKGTIKISSMRFQVISELPWELPLILTHCFPFRRVAAHTTQSSCNTGQDMDII